MDERMRVHLVPITKDNIDEVLALRVREDQKNYVSSTAESLAQAYVYVENAFPFAVYDDEIENTGLTEFGMEEMRMVLH